MGRIFFIILFCVACLCSRADTLHVYFPAADTGLTENTKTQIKVLFGNMLDKSSLHVLDNTGDMRRGQWVVSFMKQNGIAPQRMKLSSGGVAGPAGEAHITIVYSPIKHTWVPPVKVYTELEDLIDQATVGQSLALNNIQFVAGQAVVLPESARSIGTLYNIMAKNTTLKIQIEGHVCCLYEREGDTTGPGYKLSLSRANTIYDYLVKRGISPSRMSYTGFSAWRRLKREYTPEDEATNRRVEIRIIEK